MDSEFSADDEDVERRIEGEFMRDLRDSDVPFEIVEVMEDLIEEPDLGGKDEIIDRVESEVRENGD